MLIPLFSSLLVCTVEHVRLFFFFPRNPKSRPFCLERERESCVSPFCGGREPSSFVSLAALAGFHSANTLTRVAKHENSTVQSVARNGPNESILLPSCYCFCSK